MGIALSIILLFFSGENAENDLHFSRDHLRVAHQQWTELYNAELLEVEQKQSDTYGFSQIRTYRTTQGEQAIQYYINYKEEVYDIGLKQPEELDAIALDKSDRIISRVLWAAALNDPVLVSALWFSGTGSVQFTYDDRIGNQDELLRSFLNDVQTSGSPANLSGIESTENRSTIQLSTGGRVLELEFIPNINLYLNGQLDIISQKIEAGLKGEIEPAPISDTHPFHSFEVNGDAFSARFIARDRSEFNLEFKKIDGTWKPVGEAEDLGFEHPLQHEHYSFWATRNFPEGFRLEASSASQLAVRVLVEGVSESFNVSDKKDYFNSIGWLGHGMLSHTEVSNFREEEDHIRTTTYILYFDPELQYQHMIRINDRFLKSGNNADWVHSEMHILPAIRLDNVGDIYGRSNFPIREYEELFEIDASN